MVDKKTGNENHYPIRIPPETRQKLEAIAKSQGQPPRTLARQVITQFVESYRENKTAE